MRTPSFDAFTRIECTVAPVVSLGGPARHGERRFVPILGGAANGPGLSGTLLEGGVDWQVQRADGATDIAAHYVIRTAGGALVEVQSEGLRHGPAAVMAALARGEPVPPEAYFFRTVMKFTSGHPDWLHLNRLMCIAIGTREPTRVLLDVWNLT